MLKQRTALQSEIRLRPGFGDALVANNESDLTLSQRAAVLGIEIHGFHRVYRTHARGIRRRLEPHESFGVAELIRNRLRLRGIHVQVLPVGPSDFVVVHQQRDTSGQHTEGRLPGVVRKVLREALVALNVCSTPEVRIAIGIGEPHAGINGLRRSHQEATRALEVVRLVGDDDGDGTISQAGSYSILTATPTHEGQLFVRQYLESLLDYDRKNGGEYVKTLVTYFEEFGNIQQTSDRLFLHLSTVRYRLKRIEKITGLSFAPRRRPALAAARSQACTPVRR
ncbi:PucR family transcriptional regulator [Rhodococcus koreensis]|uniref:PucR family transcriptional regulator n=1 Tax=Rhodococcus koreensis TaxID=99653 RepID=UPI00366E9B83